MKTVDEIRQEYDWLDKASLEDYILEFVKRNETFKGDSALIIKKGELTENDRMELFRKYRVFVDTSPFLKIGDLRATGLLPICLPPAVVDFWTFPKGYPDDSPVLKKIRKQHKDYSIGFSKDNKQGPSDVDRLLQGFFGWANSNGEYPIGENLIVKINLNVARKDILPRINNLLSLYEKKRKKRRRIKDDKWKYYLIVYDLLYENQKLPPDEIEALMKEAYPGYRYHFTKKNCSIYYDKAFDLIHKGYKDFM